MTRKPYLCTAAAGVLFGALLLFTPAEAFVVFDPSNYAENVAQAASALTQIQNQVTSLAHEVTMLEDEAKNLTSRKTGNS